MKKVVMYSTASCPWCVHAKQLLERLEIPYEEIRVDSDESLRLHMEKISQRRTVPQIFIGDKHVGGFDDLKRLYERDELNAWLQD
jgi:glutaredoxin 3